MNALLEIPPDKTGASLRAVRLARRLDRLPSGKYTILLDKPDMEGAGWVIRIDGEDLAGQTVHEKIVLPKHYFPE